MTYSTLVRQSKAARHSHNLPQVANGQWWQNDVVECVCGERFVARYNCFDYLQWTPLRWYHRKALRLLADAA